VLVHGDWADGSSWAAVIDRLQDRGFNVVAPPNTLRGPAADATYLASYLQTIQGPIVLVAHSYGGFVTTNAALGNTNVKALVYIDAYLPAQGDTLLSLTAHAPGSKVSPTVFNGVPSASGVVDTYVQPALFPGIFANDLPAAQGAVLAASQEPLAQSALGEPSGVPAYTEIPSWDLIGTRDNVIPPATQAFMAARAGSHVETVAASHLSMISHPDRVEGVIVEAVKKTA
jgi:pimeloyl-ACP methyl ester carboxylesterase